MFDDDDGVPGIGKIAEDPGEEVGIPWMKANRRFVEHVKCANQPGTQLIGQRDPLCLTTGQRLGLSVERQIPKADALEKALVSLEAGGEYPQRSLAQ